MTDFHKYLESLLRGDCQEEKYLLGADREPFTFPTAKAQWAPPRHYAIELLTIDWKMDLEEQKVDAISKLRIKSIVPELTKLQLHAAEIDISSITDSKGEPVAWDMRTEDESMWVYLKDPLKQGEVEELTFTYILDNPRGGLYFKQASPEFPDMETSAWTQMQDDYCRYVVPVYDNPSHKFPFEAIITVPKGFFAMSNGTLVSREMNDDGTETFHWKQKLPLPAYLITVAVSDYEEYKDERNGLEVSYYAHKKWDKETVYRSFGKTPDMIEFFVKKLDVDYPWAKYAQVTAADFLIGGMENTSATTQTEDTLHDEKAHRDYQSDGLVSHELAHMWGGDLVTCRTWSHGWLNEGWATQMQNEWKRHDLGYDEYLYEQYGKQMSYFDEDKKNYRRPIVQNKWERGSDVFDRHLYPGAAWRYYMLKHLVGEERWWKILGEWLTRYAHKSVYTHDLESLFTEMTGEDYGWFFDQWVYKAGYPECKIKCSYDEKLGHALVSIEQTQKSDDDMTPDVFRFPLSVEFVHDDEKQRYIMEVSEKKHSFYYPIDTRPKQILVDPDYTVLMDWDIEKSEALWIEQLKNGKNIIQRIKAAQALGKKASPKAIDALGKSLVKDEFWGVQAEIAKVLGDIKNESALDQLLKGTKIEHSKARTAVATALGNFFKNERAYEALLNLVNDHESYFVAAAAATSIGKTQHENAFDFLSKEIRKAPSSWRDMIEVGYLQGIAATEDKRAIKIIREYTALGVSDHIRRAAPLLLAKLGKRHKKQNPQIKEELEKMLHDNSYRVKLGAISAAKTYGDAALIPALTRLAESEVESIIVRQARVAIRALGKKKEDTEIRSVKKTVEEIERENRDLKDRLSKIEAMLEKDE
ncbi:MAG: hypothetical protein BAJATHORv1_20666 [Candidatus Thorarchaeota archaeon]|nr:MAG: hypothetical protein BAJATHORv1_20666 [Candidatus Thorarchaeota archaeon]